MAAAKGDFNSAHWGIMRTGSWRRRADSCSPFLRGATVRLRPCRCRRVATVRELAGADPKPNVAALRALEGRYFSPELT